MTQKSEFVVLLSKTKLALLLIGSIAFVIAGLFLLSLDESEIKRSIFNSPTLIYGVAVVCVVFFFTTGVIGVRKMFDATPGLIVNETGIIDNSSGVSAGLIPWDEIVGLEQYQLQGNQFVSILVTDPLKYVNRGNVIQRFANRANYKMCGTPINISANGLQITFDELYEALDDFFTRYHQEV